MAIAESTIVYDGQTYQKGDTLPDLGSLICVEAQGNKRSYEGMISDFSKLPTYVDNGSSALLYNGTGTTKVYHFLNGTWYEL